MYKKIASEEVLKAVGALMRSTFCFFNHIPDTNLAENLIGIAFLPFTAKFINNCSEQLVKQISSALNLTVNLENRELGQAI